MRLKTISYSEWDGGPQEWTLDGLELADINLIVGKNASGKSRALNIISALAAYLTNEKKAAHSGKYDVCFEEEGTKILYELRFKDGKVAEEELQVDGVMKLQRGEGGRGQIFAHEIDQGRMVPFQTPEIELAAVARRDAIQHPFLQPLYDWADSVRHYHFGTQLGKRHLAVLVKDEKDDGPIPNAKDPNQVVVLYQKAVKEFPTEFEQLIKADMERLDYPNETIGLEVPVSIRFESVIPGKPVGLCVKEKDMRGITDQHSMSQGMFRALSLLILTSYCQLSKKASCILIDDIGEGLDFDRSCRLIDLLREKAKSSDIQLIMATNDRFVMNKVPLEEWSVLVREGSQIRVLNYRNSKKLFDEFKFMGLSNFDFLAHDFAHTDEESFLETLEDEATPEEVSAKGEE